MESKRRWIWVALFVGITLLLGVLAAGYNVVLVRDYERLVELARSLSQRPPEPQAPWWQLAVGTLGFLALLGGLVTFFVRLLREMQLNQSQSEFLASVSHALKTPIATLELASSLLKSGELSEEERSHLWASHAAELQRLKEQVETLLESARWEAAPVGVQPERLELESWIQASWPRWQRLLGNSASLRREGAPLECDAWLDPKILSLITDNLVDNARKFSREMPELTLRSEILPPSKPWQKPRWRMSFIDSGWGFEPADSGRIFKRFVRARTSAPYAIPGTGLGLHLAASAAETLRLKLSADSDGPGKGARFVMEGAIG